MKPVARPETLTYRLRYLLPYYRQHRWAFFFGFLLLVSTSGAAAAIPYTMKLATEAGFTLGEKATRSGKPANRVPDKLRQIPVFE